MLTIIDTLPEALLSAGVSELQTLLGGPTLIHLPGRRPQPLLVTVLLHGNEDTGFYAIQRILNKYRDTLLPRALSVYIGNVSAASQGLRRLEGQPDYNRVWPGTPEPDSPERRMMQQVIDDIRERQPFAAIDIHNNTGINPHYACINRVADPFLHLGALFSRTLVYFTRPQGVASLAMAELCPAVTVESGKPGHPHGVEHAADFIDAVLHLSAIPDHKVAAHDIDLFHTVAIIKVPETLSFGFAESGRDIVFQDDLDHLNFLELQPGTALAYTRNPDARLEAWDEQGRDVGANYFHVENERLCTLRPLMPSMLTLDERVIRQDCLGYLMERYPLS